MKRLALIAALCLLLLAVGLEIPSGLEMDDSSLFPVGEPAPFPRLEAVSLYTLAGRPWA